VLATIPLQDENIQLPAGTALDTNRNAFDAFRRKESAEKKRRAKRDAVVFDHSFIQLFKHSSRRLHKILEGEWTTIVTENALAL